MELLIFLAVALIFIGSVLCGFGIWLWVAFWKQRKNDEEEYNWMDPNQNPYLLTGKDLDEAIKQRRQY